MTAPFKLLAMWVALLALPLALAARDENPRLTVDVRPNPASLGSEIVFTVSVNPPVDHKLLYQFFVDGRRVSGDDWRDSPQFTYVPLQTGSHVVHAEARVANQIAILSGERTPFEVQPEVAPTQPPPAALALTLTLASSKVVAGEPAAFTVSIQGASALSPYVLDLGDGSAIQTRSDTEFTHVYKDTGVFTASVSFPAGTPGSGSSVPVNVDPPPAPLALTLKLRSSKVVAGKPATFGVSVEGADAVPPYVLDAGDGSAIQTRSDAEFTHVYKDTGVFTASVSFPAGTPGSGSRVLVTVAPAPLALTLTLSASRVVADEPAAFEVSVEGAGTVPQYVFNAGDGSTPEPRSDAKFTHVFRNAGVFTASVSLPTGVPGRGSSVRVDVSPGTPPTWQIAVVILLAIAGTLMFRKAIRKDVDPAIAPTFHPEPDFEPRFDPAEPTGITLEVHLVSNLVNVRFTPRVRIGR